jgi:hypothetical protein
MLIKCRACAFTYSLSMRAFSWHVDGSLVIRSLSRSPSISRNSFSRKMSLTVLLLNHSAFPSNLPPLCKFRRIAKRRDTGAAGLKVPFLDI